MEALFMRLSYATIPAFWPIWLLGLAAILFCCSTSRTLAAQSAPPGPWLNGLTPTLLLIALPLTAYLGFMLWSVEFTYHDNDVFTEFTARGRSWDVTIWPHEGRYFPLAHQEFNALRWLGPTPIVYHSLAALQLVAVVLLCCFITRELSLLARLLTCWLALFSSGIAIAFADIVYPERNIVFWLALLVAALTRLQLGGGRLAFTAALVATQFALYYKEPVVVLIGVVALLRLVHALGGTQLSALRPRAVFAAAPLECSLLLQCAIFAGQMAVSMLAFRSSAYVSRASIGPLQSIVFYATTDPLFVVLLVLVVLRLWQLAFKRRAFDRLWDPLALGALGYAGALIVSGLAEDRYMPPVDLLAALLLTRALDSGWRQTQSRLVLAASIAVVVPATTVFGVFRLIEHKTVVRSTALLADFVLERSRQAPRLTLHFPHSLTWRVMNVATYLRHRGARVATTADPAAPIQLVSGRPDATEQCVSYLPYRCAGSAPPADEELVIELADDEHDRAPARAVLLELAPLALYSGPLASELYRIRPMRSRERVPNGWLTTRVMVRD